MPFKRIAQDTLRTSLDLLRKNYSAEWWSREVLHPRTCSVTAFCWRTSCGLSPLDMRRSRAAGFVRHVTAGMIGWGPNRKLVVQDSTVPRATVFRAHAAPQGTCEHLVNALKLLTNQQKGGDSPVETVVTGLWERKRNRITDGLRKFISEVNHEALKVRDFHQQSESKWFTSPGAVIKEGADELTSRAHEEGVLRTFYGHIEFGRPKEGSLRWSTRTDTPSARPSFRESKDQRGGSHVSTRTCT